jgi:GT2 family glycosyltransferase
VSVSRTAVVVVSYGSSQLLAQNLVASTSPGDLVVVVDNWTDADERRAVTALARSHGWLLETPLGNTGFGGGMNLGVARAIAAGASSLLLLNPDARLLPSDRQVLVEQVEADPSLLLAPRIVTSDGTPWMSGLMDLRLEDGTVRSSRHRRGGESVMEWVSGAVMVLDVRLWQQIGGFDDDYFLYWEDVDLCRRVHEVGGAVRVDQAVTAIHDGGGRAKSEAFYFHNIRNRALFAAKWLSPRERRRWAVRTPSAAWATMLTGGRRQFVETVRPWRALVRGLLASARISLRAAPPGSSAHNAGVVRVLESFATPSSLTNPYITQLRDALAATPGVEVHCWEWRKALVGGYDVFHAHWPEALIERRDRLTTIARRVFYAVFLLRLLVTRTPVVRTVHNVQLPSGLSPVETRLLEGTDRLTRERVVLNEFTPLPAGASSTLVEHGHYRDWFARYDQPEQVRGRVAFIGKVRRYKNVEGLVAAFRELPRDGEPYSLHIAGKPSSGELAQSLQASAAADPRISLDLSFIDDATLVSVVGEAELVVLPYLEMHNSGSVLAVLSLDRPVLVPAGGFNQRLAEEVGPGWVTTFEGDLTADDIVRALEQVRQGASSARPDLSAREWSDAGSRHLRAFRRALRPARTGLLRRSQLERSSQPLRASQAERGAA